MAHGSWIMDYGSRSRSMSKDSNECILLDFLKIYVVEHLPWLLMNTLSNVISTKLLIQNFNRTIIRESVRNITADWTTSIMEIHVYNQNYELLQLLCSNITLKTIREWERLNGIIYSLSIYLFYTEKKSKPFKRTKARSFLDIFLHNTPSYWHLHLLNVSRRNFVYSLFYLMILIDYKFNDRKTSVMLLQFIPPIGYTL